MGLAHLSRILWLERDVLEMLLKNLTQRLEPAAPGCRIRPLSPPAANVRLLDDQLRCAEVLRAAEVESLAAELGPGTARTLTSLVDVAPAAWSLVLTEYGDELRALCEQITPLVGARLGPVARPDVPQARRPEVGSSVKPLSRLTPRSCPARLPPRSLLDFLR
jgi:hypothetical protein